MTTPRDRSIPRFQKPENTMTTPVKQRHLIPITDDRGRHLIREALTIEPEPGSVVLVNGEFGSAWQRMFDDGLWTCVLGGKPRTWEYILSRRNVVLVYDAAVR